MTSTDEVVALINAGRSAAEVLRLLTPEDDASFLARCAVVRTFDDELLELLRDGLEPEVATAEQMVEARLAEPVPGSERLYRLRPGVREQYAPPAGSIPPELRALSKKLVHYYRERDPLEALYHQFAVDPDAARERFEDLYIEADARFDRARCRDLIDVLGERRAFDPALTELRNDYRSYLGARGFWVDDWFRTARFTEPSRAVAALERLLTGQSSRILQLWGPGGMGKTMLLRWLIARRCVPKPPRIACARIDFDGIVAIAALREPWLVLLAIAEQLNEQLYGAPFNEVLRERAAYLDRLRQPRGDRGATTSIIESQALETIDSVDTRDRIVSALTTLQSYEDIVVVLDTLEVALLLDDPERDEEAILPLLGELGKLHDAAPRVRFVLAGRYDLSERIRAFRTVLPKADTHQLEGFTEEEARAYLVDKRGLTDPDVVQAAATVGRVRAAAPAAGATSAAQRARGIMPFRLALVADVVENRPDMTAEEILEYEDVDLLYLIERVVERVEPQIQWLLRYGVVPRVLDLPFAIEVLAPVLEDVMADRATADPARDRVPYRKRATVPVWSRDILSPGEPVKLGDLWTLLRQYAGRASWVAVDARDGERVQFHPDVVNPMRRLIADDEKLPDLQRRAVAYFERKAKRTRGQWATWMREAVYHRFQLEGPDAASYWRARLAEARGSPEARRILAEDLVGDSYREGGKARRWRGRRQLVSRTTDIEARYELAWAEAQKACDEGRVTETAWVKARQALKDVEHRQKELARAVVTPAKLALVHAAVELTFDGVKAARPWVRKALAGRLHREDRLWILVQFAEALSATSSREAEQHLRDALRLASRAPALPQWRRRILQKLAAHWVAQDDLDNALEAAEEAARGGDAGSKARLLLPELYLRRGEPTQALDLLRRTKSAGRLGALEVAVGEARTLIARWQPQEARAVATTALSSLVDGSTATGDPLRDRRLAAELTECCGIASCRLLDVDAAHRYLLSASSLWSELAESDAAFRAQLQRARFQLRELGEPAEASLMLAKASLPPIMSGELRRELALLESEIAVRRGDREKARRRANTVLKEIERGGAAPHEVVAAALAALVAADHAEQQRLLKLVAKHLRQIRPASARLLALAPLRYCPTLENPDPKAATRLRDLVRLSSRPGEKLTLDKAILTFWSAEVDRFLGHPQAAAAKLGRIRAKLTRNGRNAYALGEWLAAAARAGVSGQSLPRREELQLERLASEVSPLVGAGVLILAALLTGGTMPRLVEEAGLLLGRGVSSTGGLRARLYEVLARAALGHGNVPEATARATEAVELYTKLGDEASAERVAKAFTARGAPKPAPPRPPKLTPASRWPAAVISLETVDAKLRVTAEPAGGARAVSAPPRSRLSSLVREWDSAGPLYGATKVFVEQWPALRADMGRLLERALPPDPKRKRPDVRLRIKDPRLDQIPWELAEGPGGREKRLFALEPRIRHLHRTNLERSPASSEVRSLQATLNVVLGGDLRVDGLLGPATRAATTEFGRQAGLSGSELRDLDEWDIIGAVQGPPRVLVVRSTVGHEELAYRGSTQGGAPLEYLYSERGLGVAGVLESPDLAELQSAVRELRPAYVHLVANLVDRGSTVGLDLGVGPQALESGTKWTRGGRLTAGALDSVLRGALPKPFVIVETPAPRSLYEAANQLFLRNGFAAALFAFENARAVIGIGLARYTAQQVLHLTLLDGLARARTLGDVVRAVRQRAHEGPGAANLEHAMAFGATALFSRRADSKLPSASRR